MKKKILFLILSVGTIIFSCKQQSNTQEVHPPEQFTTPMLEDKIVHSYVVNNNGDTLYISFNNTKDTAILELHGEKIYMKNDTMASGIRMRNQDYEYQEWHGHVVLKKDGNVIFDNEGVTPPAQITDKEGRQINITFDNDNNTATLEVNNEKVLLKEDRTASGIKYSNKDYEYEEWQGNIVVKKDGRIIFDNSK